jgi:hypothetical protein
VIASLDRICERVGTAGLVAQLQQPFTGNMVLAPPAHHRYTAPVPHPWRAYLPQSSILTTTATATTTTREVMALISGAVSVMTALQSALQSVCSVGGLPPAASSASPPLVRHPPG